VALLEKGREIGSHGLSGAVLDPRALLELYPDFERLQCPLESPVKDDAVWFLTAGRRLPLPIVPPPLRNHGNHITSLGRLVRWLAARAEAEGVDLFPGFAAVEPLVEEGRVVGVRTGDKGIDRNGNRKDAKKLRTAIITDRSKALSSLKKRITAIEEEITKLEYDVEQDTQRLLEVTVKGEALNIKKLSQAIRENKARIDGRFAELQTATNEHDEKAKTFDQQLEELAETT